MAPEFMSQFPDCLNTIFISNCEACDVNWFVNQYIESRQMRSRLHVEHEVFDALRDYPGMAPVRLFELNAWLDKNLRPKLFQRSAVRTLKLIINNEHILQRP